MESGVAEPSDDGAPEGEVDSQEYDLHGDDEVHEVLLGYGVEYFLVVRGKKFLPRQGREGQYGSREGEKQGAKKQEQIESPEFAAGGLAGEVDIFFRQAQDEVLPEGGAGWSVHHFFIHSTCHGRRQWQTEDRDLIFKSIPVWCASCNPELIRS
ncbi:hypothetical protein HMPREF3038_02426 [Akkermansia sp. KLE1797]|nr:hypothetical protein HMPREF3038_02426 [Akkermansia sp. KLE1797]